MENETRETMWDEGEIEDKGVGWMQIGNSKNNERCKISTLDL